MARGAQVTQQVAALDELPAMLVCDWKLKGGEQLSPAIRHVSQCVLVAGEQPSYALVALAMADPWDELAPAVALCSDGPCDIIKPRTRARINWCRPGANATIPVMTGTLVQYRHDLTQDCAIGEVFDDKFLMSKITLLGAWTRNPEQDVTDSSGVTTQGKAFFDAGRPCIFNQFGQPDCIEDAEGNVLFAPSYRYGYTTSEGAETFEEPPPGSVLALTKARSWRCQDIMRYLWQYCSNEGVKSFPAPYNYGKSRLPKVIHWAKNLGSDRIGWDRVPRHFVAENKTLLKASSDLCRKAGAYDLLMSPVNDWDSQLGIANMNPHGSRGDVYLYTPKALGMDVARCMATDGAVMGGQVSESIINYSDEVVILGDPPAMETMATSASGDVTMQVILEPAWSTQEQDAFNAYLAAHHSSFFYDRARETWPLVFAAYRIKYPIATWDGTIWEVIPSNSHPRILETLLSSYGGTNGGNPGNWQRREIYVEYTPISAGTGGWAVATKSDSLALSPDSRTLFLPGMATAAKLQTCHPADALKPFEAMLPNMIRLTLAFEGEQRNTQYGIGDPNNASERIEAYDDDYAWSHVVVAEKGDYVAYLRKGSHPCGYAQIPEPWQSINFPDADAPGLGLFQDNARQYAHAMARLADVRRIEYGGQVILGRLWNGLRVGDPVIVEGNGITPKGIIKSITLDGSNQQVIIEIAKADNAKAYDNSIISHVQSPARPAPEAVDAAKAKQQQEPSMGSSWFDEPADASQLAWPMTRKTR